MFGSAAERCLPWIAKRARVMRSLPPHFGAPPYQSICLEAPLGEVGASDCAMKPGVAAFARPLCRHAIVDDRHEGSLIATHSDRLNENSINRYADAPAPQVKNPPGLDGLVQPVPVVSGFRIQIRSFPPERIWIFLRLPGRRLLLGGGELTNLGGKMERNPFDLVGQVAEVGDVS